MIVESTRQLGWPCMQQPGGTSTLADETCIPELFPNDQEQVGVTFRNGAYKHLFWRRKVMAVHEVWRKHIGTFKQKQEAQLAYDAFMRDQAKKINLLR